LLIEKTVLLSIAICLILFKSVKNNPHIIQIQYNEPSYNDSFSFFFFFAAAAARGEVWRGERGPNG
jgi:hypothetical protein